jgi:alpha-1,2-mannosyltransferase
VSRSPVSRTLLTAFLLLLLAAVLFVASGQRKMRDFEVYWTAGARAADAAPLYPEDDGHYRFKYLPAFAVAVAPLSGMPLDAAKATWMALSVLCLGVLVSVAAASAGPAPLSRPALIALTVIAMAKFFAHELVLGQANLLFGAICAAGLAALLRRRDAVAGGCFGLAVLVKPYAVLFLPYLLLTRRWRAAAATALATAAVLLVPALAYGLDGTIHLTRQWWETASETSAPLLTNADAISVFAMYAKWIGWGAPAATLSLVTIAALAAAFLIVLAHRRHVTAPETLEVGMILTLIPLVTPQGWDYVLLLSTPLIALLIARTAQMPRGDRAVWLVAIAVVAFSLFDVMGRAAYAAFMGLAVVTICYLAILSVAVRLRLCGAA